MAEPRHHALVVGASGLIGWSVVNQLTQDSSQQPFYKVSALVNRTLELKGFFWPRTSPGCPELQLVSSVNLSCTEDELESYLRENVVDVASISHVYYFGKHQYVHAKMMLTRVQHSKVTMILKKKSRPMSA